MPMHRTPPTTLRALLRSPPRGAAIVEFALILPFLIWLMLLLFDLGFGAYQLMQVHAAAEAGAQYAAIKYPGGIWTPGQIAAIAAAVASATGTGGIAAIPAPSQVCGCPDGGVFTLKVSCGSCPSGSPAGVYASVSAQVSYSPVLPYPGLPDPLTLTGQAYRRIN
jgi:Flp pilus assembly protein TadG